MTEAELLVAVIQQVLLDRNKFSTLCYPPIQQEIELTSRDCKHVSAGEAERFRTSARRAAHGIWFIFPT